MLGNFFRSSKKTFIVRSPERDRETDAALVGKILSTIEESIERSEAERAGLQARVDDLLSRAAIVAGNDLNDYVTRTDERSKMLRESEDQVRTAQIRLATLKENLSHFIFLKNALKSRFP